LSFNLLIGKACSSVNDAPQLPGRELRRRDPPRGQLGPHPLEDLVVGQPAGLQLRVPPPDIGLDRLAEMATTSATTRAASPRLSGEVRIR